MAIQFIAAGTVATGASPTVTVPTGYQADDLLLIVLVNASSVTPTVAAASGFLPLFTAQGTSSCYMSAFYKFASASESSVAVTTSGAGGSSTVASMLAYRGVRSIDQVSATPTTVNSTTVTCPTVTTVTNLEYAIRLFGVRNTSGSTFSATPATNRLSSDATGTFCGLAISDSLKEWLGSTGTATATIASGTNNTGMTISVSQNPRRTVLFTTTGSTQSYAVPSDYAGSPRVIAIGGGGAGRTGNGNSSGGGGGGGYSSSSSITVTAGSTTIYASVGAATGATWIATSNGSPANSASGALANGGSNATGGSGGSGGALSSAIGNVVTAGGIGGTGAGVSGAGGGGGGGAAGNILGGNYRGFNGVSTNDVGGGGAGTGEGSNLAQALGGAGIFGAAGGTAGTASAQGGAGANGSGGGGGYGTSTYGIGGVGGAAFPLYTSYTDGTTGDAGGGGGGANKTGGNGGLYGGGGGGANATGGAGGTGAQGVAIFTYIVSSYGSGNFFLTI